jgi:hypothetical protein
MKHVLTILMLFLPVLVVGQFAGAPFRVGHSPYAASMGNAMVATSDAGMSYFNPALAANSKRRQIELSSAVMTFDRSLSAITFTTPLPPVAGLTIGLVYSGVGEFDGRTLSGYPTDVFSIYEAQIFTQFGIRIGKNTQMGAGVKVSMADYGNNVDPAMSVGLDIGLRRRLSDRLAFGLTAQDMIGSYTWNTQDLWGTIGSNQQVDQFPLRLKAGLEYIVRPDELTLYAETERRVLFASYTETSVSTSLGEPIIFTETVDVTNAETLFRFGGQWAAHERFHVRMGYQSDSRLSGGFSLRLPDNRFSPSIEYSLSSEPSGFSSIHQFALRFHL